MKLDMDNLSYEKLLENKNFLGKARNVLADSFGENFSMRSDEEVFDEGYFEVSPFIALRWSSIAGEDYGRSHVEDIY